MAFRRSLPERVRSMGGLGGWWGMRPVAENEGSAKRREREACAPRQELTWASYSYSI